MPLEAVIEERDKDFSIYEVPLSLVDNGLDELIIKKLRLPSKSLDLNDWRQLLHRLRNPEHEISIAVVGKYAEHVDAYKSIYESLDHAGVHHGVQIRIGRIHSETVEKEGPERLLERLRWHPGAGRLWRTGHRRQGRRDPLRSRAAGSFLWHLPRHAVCRH